MRYFAIGLLALFSATTTMANICNRSPKIAANISSQLNLPCRSIGANDLLKITEINVRISGMSSIKDYDFDGLKNLKVLKIGRNTFTQLPSGIFKDLKNLTYLDIEFISLTSLRARMFQDLTALETLVLADDFSVIEKDTFQGLNKLKHLSLALWADEAPIIERGAFLHLDELTSLDFAWSKHLPLHDGIFIGMPSLTYMNFTPGGGCPEFQGLRNHAFEGLTKLRSLDFSRCYGFSEPIEDQAFAGLASLEQLILPPSGSLKKLTKTMLQGLSNLRVVKMPNLEMTEIEPGALSGTHSLETIDFSGNKITKLPPDVFSGLTRANDVFISVNFSGNLISALPDGIFQGAPLKAQFNFYRNNISALSNSMFDLDCFDGATFNFLGNPVESESIRRLKPLMCDRLQVRAP